MQLSTVCIPTNIWQLNANASTICMFIYLYHIFGDSFSPAEWWVMIEIIIDLANNIINNPFCPHPSKAPAPAYKAQPPKPTYNAPQEAPHIIYAGHPPIHIYQQPPVLDQVHYTSKAPVYKPPAPTKPVYRYWNPSTDWILESLNDV